MSLRSNFAADTLEVLKDRIGQSTRAGTEASAPNGWPPFKTGRRAIVQITRNSNETAPGPSEWFTGTVYIDAVATPLSGSHLHASSVHFTPGARTAWHTHPKGQTIWVTEGVGLAQRRGGPIEVIGPGDRVFFEPGEDHWHGAAPNRFMTHLAMLEVDETGDIATWGDQVTDEEYAEAPPIDG